MQRTKLFLFFIASALSLLSGCATQSAREIDPMNLHDLETITDTGAATCDNPIAGQLKGKALEDTALSLGAQAGLATSSQKIDAMLELNKKYLETTYNFNGMMLEHGVLPPVLVEGDFTLNQSDPDTIRVSDRTYKIVEQAHFATTPPNWREYLWMSYPRPVLPHRVLLPKTADEQMIWARAIRRGWNKGTEQAYDIFNENLARLKRDFNGMILYRKLLQENMVSPPFVSRTELGVTGDGENMRVNDQVLRITELPKLQTESKNWKAIVVNRDTIEEKRYEQPVKECGGYK